MTEEGMISLTEFKTALEDVRSDIKRVVEVVNHRFDRVETDIRDIKHEVGVLHEGQTTLKIQFTEMRQEQETIKGQIVVLQKGQDALQKGQDALQKGQDALQKSHDAMRKSQDLLIKGQNEIKAELRHKADAKDLARLDKRVTRLENKVA